jgi:hypothetical protein
MMERFKIYFGLQLKRVAKIFPAIALITMAMFVCLGFFALTFLNFGEQESDKKKYQIGIVGNVWDSYLGFGIYAIQNIDDSKFMIDFSFLSEKEAREQLAMGELTAYVVIPDGLIESLDTGANDLTIVYYTAEGQKGITSILMDRLADIVSDMVTYSQGAIYSMQQMLCSRGRYDEVGAATDRLNIFLIDLILSRGGLCNVNILGVSDGLTMEKFYFCSLLLLFMLISGINSSSLFGRRNEELPRLLSGRGLGAMWQVMGEYLAYLCLTLACLLEIFLVLGIVSAAGFEGIDKILDSDLSSLIGFYIKMIPVAAAVTAMQFMLYEFVSGVVNGIMIQFISAVSMAYISGYFYPERFFPKTIQNIGGALPTGVAFDYTAGCILNESRPTELLALLVYMSMFLFVAVLVRKYRIRKG